jgi:hypothetical protein
MSELIALGAGVMIGLMVFFTPRAEWTPPFFIVIGGMAVLCIVALLIDLVEGFAIRRHRERMAKLERPTPTAREAIAEAVPLTKRPKGTDA